ncbi:MAG: hypothetical protein ACLF0P_12900 [Thermoanaerobaculia bacterium]
MSCSMEPDDETPSPETMPTPELPLVLRTDNPLALISATRLALRRAGRDRNEIDRFTRDALESPDPRSVCSRFARLPPGSDDPRRA